MDRCCFSFKLQNECLNAETVAGVAEVFIIKIFQQDLNCSP